MNQLIKTLAQRSGLAFAEYSPGFPDIKYPEGTEKFAELLIAACIEIMLTGTGNEYTSDAVWDLESLGVDVAAIVAQISAKK